MEAPFQRHSDTSRAAAEHITSSGQSMRQRTEIMLLIHRSETDGMTAREVADILGIEGGTVAARFAALNQEGVLIKTAIKRGSPEGHVNVCAYFWDESMGKTGKKNYINQQMHREALQLILSVAQASRYTGQLIDYSIAASDFIGKWNIQEDQVK